ncbi:hypothetical protein BGX28_003323 [Mortierella sp. GBA30]|nr:hypothetical protein BGX28_003323 [Mortierella sp. GBA30]
MRKTLYLIVCGMVALVGVSALCVPRTCESPSGTHAENEPDVCRDKSACIVGEDDLKQRSNRSQELRKRAQNVDFAGYNNDRELEDAVRDLLSRDLNRFARVRWYASQYRDPSKGSISMDIGLDCKPVLRENAPVPGTVATLCPKASPTVCRNQVTLKQGRTYSYATASTVSVSFAGSFTKSGATLGISVGSSTTRTETFEWAEGREFTHWVDLEPGQRCQPKVAVYDLQCNVWTYEFTEPTGPAWQDRSMIEMWYDREVGTTAYKVDRLGQRFTSYYFLKGQTVDVFLCLHGDNRCAFVDHSKWTNKKYQGLQHVPIVNNGAIPGVLACVHF